MTCSVIKFPTKARTNENTTSSFISMTMTSSVNGRTVVTNLSNLSKEDLLHTLLRDAVSADKEMLIRKNISE